MSMGPEGIRKTPPADVEAPGLGRSPAEPPPPVPPTFDFTVSSIKAKKPRSTFNDTDYATLSINALAADNTVITQYGPITRSLGDLGDDASVDPDMSLTGLAVPEGGSLAVSFVVVNKGGWDWDSYAINALELAGSAVLGALVQGTIIAPASTTTAADGTATVLTTTTVSLPEVLIAAGIIIGALEAINILLPDCDGTVVPGVLSIGQTELLQFATPGPWDMQFRYPGTDSPDGCGPNSDYTVTYSVEATVPHVTVPNVIGLSPRAATAALTAAGLTVETRTTKSNVDQPQVITQNPPGGASVPVHSADQIEVGVPEGGHHPAP
jgi:hypothetical protein